MEFGEVLIRILYYNEGKKIGALICGRKLLWLFLIGTEKGIPPNVWSR